MILSVLAAGVFAQSAPQWLEFEGGRGPGKGKHIVFLSGDEEYRSEEGLPQLARILAGRHGFKCTVLFSINPKGEIDPNTSSNEPGMEALDKADLCIMLLRFRQWPDAQMKHFVDYYQSGKPVIALRTSTHAFAYPADSLSPYAKFSWQSKDWPGGFGKQVLGETWISHWGRHKVEATRGVIESATDPILRGVTNLFCTTDVYEAAPPADAKVLVRGQVLTGMNPSDSPAIYRKKTVAGAEQDINGPMMPIVWLRDPVTSGGKGRRVLTTTMGAATDLQNESLRRLLVNGAYWATGLEKRIQAKANVDVVGEYHPTMYGFDGFKKGVKVSDIK